MRWKVPSTAEPARPPRVCVIDSVTRKVIMWSTPCFNAAEMPSMISGPMNIRHRPRPGTGWRRSRAAGPAGAVLVEERGGAQQQDRHQQLRDQPLRSEGERGAMPTITPARITTNNGRIWSGPMPSVRIRLTTP